MKQAIISDIHSNLEALSAVLARIDTLGVDQIVCLGDVVGYGPNPLECIGLVRQRVKTCLLGNHDQAALFDPEGFNSGAERAIFWTREQLEKPASSGSTGCWDFLGELPRSHREGDTIFVHGSPRNPLNEYVFLDDIYDERKMDRLFSIIPKYSFQGHTHVPGVFTESREFFSPSEIDNKFVLADKKLMINVGSVGQPRDNDPRACFVTVDGSFLEFHRVEYPVEKTIAKIAAIPELDPYLGARLRIGR
ncbi:MAG: metallophosphoesterase family protein [Thermoguttaceae bacterium]